MKTTVESRLWHTVIVAKRLGDYCEAYYRKSNAGSARFIDLQKEYGSVDRSLLYEVPRRMIAVIRQFHEDCLGLRLLFNIFAAVLLVALGNGNGLRTP